MNKQKTGSGIEWTQIGGRTGYTWNPIGGCFHDCKWQMPDGTIAGCYAKDIAEKVARSAYPQGFEHSYWHPEKLEEPLKLKQGAGIFLDSMSDLMGHWVEDSQIHDVLTICRQASQHIFFLLTKNPRRLSHFSYPDNVFVGASCPPDYFKGQALTEHQQDVMMHQTLKSLALVEASVKWVSFEPLSRDYHRIVASQAGAINWAVIGAASKGKEHFAPDAIHFKAMKNVLDGLNVPMFFKGNMECLPDAVRDWREDYPLGITSGVTGRESVDAPTQMSLF